MQTKNNAKNSKNHPLVKLKRRIRYHYFKILRLDDPPERIARGAAIGVFMGIFPTFGAGSLLALAAAFVLKANKAASVIGSLIMNPLTSVFFWTLSAVIGAAIFNEDSSVIVNAITGGNGEGALWNFGRVTMIYIAGNLVLSTTFTAAAYFIVKKAIIGHRRRKEEKRRAKKEYTRGTE
ncbi:MAG: DUF2062 domain-containing protein [Deltaproteobacteria bacterium]|nr:DUF2062 domain-containing protein [Deltaproteobacteria bacterium]